MKLVFNSVPDPAPNKPGDRAYRAVVLGTRNSELEIGIAPIGRSVDPEEPGWTITWSKVDPSLELEGGPMDFESCKDCVEETILDWIQKAVDG